MKITRENYEIYIIDYLDGSLSKEMSTELMKFLRANPDLYEEFEMLSDATLPADDIEFTDKSLLKKNITDSPIDDGSIDEWCIAAIENQLSDGEKIIFEKALQNNHQWSNTYKAFLNTILPIENIKFDEHKPYQLPDFDAQPQQADIDYWIIAEKENNLTSSQLKNWNDYKPQIANLKEKTELIEKTFLSGETIHFPNKQQLKRRGIIKLIYPATTVVAAAAMLALYFNLMNMPQTTFDDYNQKVAAIENAKTIKSVDQPSDETTKKHIAKTEETPIETKSKNRGKKIDRKKTTIKTIEPIQPRQITEIADNGETQNAQPVIETITANEILLAPEIREEQEVSGQNIAEDNKLTMFKVAQRGVELVNNKVGTNMQLEKEENRQNGKKRVSFSTRLFSITKTKD